MHILGLMDLEFFLFGFVDCRFKSLSFCLLTWKNMDKNSASEWPVGMKGYGQKEL